MYIYIYICAYIIYTLHPKLNVHSFCFTTSYAHTLEQGLYNRNQTKSMYQDPSTTFKIHNIVTLLYFSLLKVYIILEILLLRSSLNFLFPNWLFLLVKLVMYYFEYFSRVFFWYSSINQNKINVVISTRNFWELSGKK